MEKNVTKQPANLSGIKQKFKEKGALIEKARDERMWVNRGNREQNEYITAPGHMFKLFNYFDNASVQAQELEEVASSIEILLSEISAAQASNSSQALLVELRHELQTRAESKKDIFEIIPATQFLVGRELVYEVNARILAA